ncbi:hypothetical protein RJ639_037196 [Escallonia herrerae]|uniref:Uncharacterized protein n=1 Tax=Escallonia herrerae TaxID=1293975 RepID=A0AA88X1T3_9ASTE|nr:hypothetical protein RJ639_037196 [Escallonia herrerae]
METSTAATVQHVTKASSDELLSKFAEVGSYSNGKKASAKKDLRASKRRRRSQNAREGDHCDSPLSSGTGSLVERKSLLPPAAAAAARRSAGLIRQLGIGRARVRTRGLKNKSIVGTIEKTWRSTVERASKVFMETHYNRHKRLINDIA